jgi:hypothetical protein
MRRLTALTAISLIAALFALGWLAWVVAAPRYWFPSAYAEKGPPGDKGPTGERGPTGPTGPVGPEAADAVGALDSELEDLASRVGALEAISEQPDLQSDIDEIRTTLANLCDAILRNYAEGNAATEKLLSDLVTACP